MRTLLLNSGDLVVTPAGHALVEGSGRVRQDLALALGEELGHDRFHQEWGSTVVRFLGSPVTDQTRLAVTSEVNRVLNAYIFEQRRSIQRDGLRQQLSRFSTSDVVQRVLGIQAVVNVDTIAITVSLETGSGESITITRTVGLS